MKGRSLRLIGNGGGDGDLPFLFLGSPETDVFVVVRIFNGGETFKHCTRFPRERTVFTPLNGGAGGKLVARGGEPTACPSP